MQKPLFKDFRKKNLIAKQSKSNHQYIVSISSSKDSRSGGQTSIGITIYQSARGIVVKLGDQDWKGIAASLGSSLLAITKNPPEREMDMLMSTGEQISCALLAMAIKHMGYDSISLTGPQVGIKTDASHTKAKIEGISCQRIGGTGF